MKRKIVIQELEQMICKMMRVYENYSEKEPSPNSQEDLKAMSKLIAIAHEERDRFKTRVEIEQQMGEE